MAGEGIGHDGTTRTGVSKQSASFQPGYASQLMDLKEQTGGQGFPPMGMFTIFMQLGAERAALLLMCEFFGVLVLVLSGVLRHPVTPLDCRGEMPHLSLNVRRGP